jgi:hypothetical protein
VALVDDEDAEWLGQWKWCSRRDDVGRYYAVRSMSAGGRRSVISMHRQILQPSAGMRTDHRNGDTLDNRRSNLREATNEQNAQNRKTPKTNRSGAKGVSLDGFKNGAPRYAASISANGKKHWLGRFDTIEEAQAAYLAAAAELHGEFMRPPL